MSSLTPHQQFEGPSSLALRGIKLHRRKKKTAYSEHIYKILKQDPQITSQSCWALDILRSLKKPQLYGKVALEASRMSHYKMKPFVTSREIHAAVKRVLLIEIVNRSWQ